MGLTNLPFGRIASFPFEKQYASLAGEDATHASWPDEAGLHWKNISINKMPQTQINFIIIPA